MQKIALIGAPSSGKTELALLLQQALPDKVAIVDNYIPEIEDRSDSVLGHFASYVGNLQAVIGRWEYERAALRDNPDTVITCGTIVESGVYNAVQALIQHNSDSGTLTVRTLQNDKRASLSMTLMGMLAHDLWDYDHSFYLPLAEDANEDDKIVDNHILECAEAMEVAVSTLSTDRSEHLAEVMGVVIDATTAD